MSATWKIPVSWEVCGLAEIPKSQCKTLEEAIAYVRENPDNIKLPFDFEYVDGSFELSFDDPEAIKQYQE